MAQRFCCIRGEKTLDASNGPWLALACLDRRRHGHGHDREQAPSPPRLSRRAGASRCATMFTSNDTGYIQSAGETRERPDTAHRMEREVRCGVRLHPNTTHRHTPQAHWMCYRSPSPPPTPPTPPMHHRSTTLPPSPSPPPPPPTSPHHTTPLHPPVPARHGPVRPADPREALQGPAAVEDGARERPRADGPPPHADADGAADRPRERAERVLADGALRALANGAQHGARGRGRGGARPDRALHSEQR